MSPSPDAKGGGAGPDSRKHAGKLGTTTGVYIPVCLNVLSILMFLRFGVILGQIGFVGIIGIDCLIGSGLHSSGG